uniref:Uncharacterized protein n=1 Tax=Steinernema glaseri TaxID=37863 RepID=A0A1I7Y084_9BILA
MAFMPSAAKFEAGLKSAARSKVLWCCIGISIRCSVPSFRTFLDYFGLLIVSFHTFLLGYRSLAFKKHCTDNAMMFRASALL